MYDVMDKASDSFIKNYSGTRNKTKFESNLSFIQRKSNSFSGDLPLGIDFRKGKKWSVRKKLA